MASWSRFRHGGKFLAASGLCQCLIYGRRVATNIRTGAAPHRTPVPTGPDGSSRPLFPSRRRRSNPARRTPDPQRLVVGVDAGGTSTRCVVSTMHGMIVGRGTSGGANSNSSSGDAAAHLGAALRAALEGLDRSAVAGGVFGIAGAASAPARARRLAQRAWAACGLTGSPEVVGDLVVAFAAGTVQRRGTVLICGTGAVAAAIHDGAVVGRCDGYGWLLGDEGSAVWLGREAVRAALAAVDGRGEPTLLADSVPARLLGPHRPHDPAEVQRAMVTTVYSGAPADLGVLAPIVCRQAEAGDRVSGRLADTAAQRLLAAVEAVHREQDGGPIVLCGSVLSAGPIADAVRAGLTARYGTRPLTTGDGALGAAGLAIRTYGGARTAHT